MKIFETPTIDTIAFTCEDVITTSSPNDWSEEVKP